MIILFFVSIWWFLGLVGSYVGFRHIQRIYPGKPEWGFLFVMSLGGPCNLAATIILYLLRPGMHD